MFTKIAPHIKKIVASKKMFTILLCLGIILVLSFVFSLGMIVGTHKASFRNNWDNHYDRNFGDSRMKHQPDDMFGHFPNAHGTAGKVISLTNPTLIVLDRDGTEKVVLTTESTRIQAMRDTKTFDDIHVDDFIVVIGIPNEHGQIEAKLIRILPKPETMAGAPLQK